MKDTVNAKYQKRFLRKTLKNIAKNDPQTREVVLNGHALDDEKIASLAMSLISNSHIRILYLHHCGITPKGAHLLAFALRKNRSLEHLWLNENRIGSAGADAFAEALFENQTLLTLGLGSNSIGNHGGKKLVEALKRNTSVTDIFLEGNRMNERIIDEINRCCAGEFVEEEEEDCSESNENYCKYTFTPDPFEDIDARTVSSSVSSSYAKKMLDSIKEEDDDSKDECQEDDDDETVDDDWSDPDYVSSLHDLHEQFDQTRQKKNKLSKFQKLGRLIRGKKVRPDDSQ